MGAQLVDAELSNALHRRIVIEQAKGIVAERARLDIEPAFSRIQQFARDHNLNVGEVAHGVVDGTLSVEGDGGTT